MLLFALVMLSLWLHSANYRLLYIYQALWSIKFLLDAKITEFKSQEDSLIIWNDTMKKML